MPITKGLNQMKEVLFRALGTDSFVRPPFPAAQLEVHIMA